MYNVFNHHRSNCKSYKWKKERKRKLTEIGMIAIQKYRLDPVSSTRKKLIVCLESSDYQYDQIDNKLQMG
jgi:hypothetical protein